MIDISERGSGTASYLYHMSTTVSNSQISNNSSSSSSSSSNDMNMNMTNMTDHMLIAFEWISSLVQRQGPGIMVVAVTITDSVPFMPTQPIAVLAGAVFGLTKGLEAIVLGQSLATILTILLGRYFLGSTMNLQRPDEAAVPSQLSVITTKTTTKNNYQTILDKSHHENDNQHNLVVNHQGVEEQEDKDEEPRNACRNKKQLSMVRVLQEMTVGLNSQDWKLVFGTIVLLRQSPVLPFSLGNYFIGATTQASVITCVLATVVGCLPLNFVWVIAGAGGSTAFLEFVCVCVCN